MNKLKFLQIRFFRHFLPKQFYKIDFPGGNFMNPHLAGKFSYKLPLENYWQNNLISKLYFKNT
jgi:hypothetical protein